MSRGRRPAPSRRPTQAGLGNAEQIRQAYDMVVRARHAGLQKASTSAPSQGLLDEIGTTGLRQYGGFVIEEWLSQLWGRKAVWAYREMMDNSPVIGAILYAVEWLARGVEWRVEEGSDPASAEFVEQCMNDMSHTWQDLVSEALSMLPYGWAWHEIVYKRRLGDQPERPFNPAGQTYAGIAGAVNTGASTQENDSNPASSDFKDGKIGWRKIPIRAQETLLNWVFDGYSGIQAMHQVDWHGGNHFIPIEKSILFRARARRNNPEGYSILRSGYLSYYYLKNIQSIEAIGIERDLAGIPKLQPPDDVDIWAPANADMLAKAQEMVTSVRRDDHEGIVLPAGWEFELVTSGGSRQIDTDAVIRRYEQRIATSMLADFILIGQDAVGSFAMVDVKADLFGLALDGILDLICEPLNRYAIPRLLKLNGMDASDPPRIAHGSAGRINLEKVGNFFNWLSMAGAPIPWSQELLESLFAEAGLPTNFDEQNPPDLDHLKEEEEPEPPVTAPKPGGPVSPGQTDPTQDPALDPNVPPTSAQPVQKADIEVCPACLAVIDDGSANCPDCGADLAAEIAKADRPKGKPVNVTPALRQRIGDLAPHLDQSIGQVLTSLGKESARVYLGLVGQQQNRRLMKAATRRHDDQRMAQQVINSVGVDRYVTNQVGGMLARHTGKVLKDTTQTLSTQLGLRVNIPDPVARQIIADGGRRVGLMDVSKQAKQAIFNALAEGRANGEGPGPIAKRIEQAVPAGRFTNAGSQYRSQLIARTETAHAQRMSTLAAYQASPFITAVEVRDGLLADSDAECEERNGDIVSFSAANDLAMDEHPLGTLSFNPLVVQPTELDEE